MPAPNVIACARTRSRDAQIACTVPNVGRRRCLRRSLKVPGSTRALCASSRWVQPRSIRARSTTPTFTDHPGGGTALRRGTGRTGDLPRAQARRCCRRPSRISSLDTVASVAGPYRVSSGEVWTTATPDPRRGVVGPHRGPGPIFEAPRLPTVQPAEEWLQHAVVGDQGPLGEQRAPTPRLEELVGAFDRWLRTRKRGQGTGLVGQAELEVAISWSQTIVPGSLNSPRV